MTSTAAGPYVFGHSDRELARLARQGRLLEPMTRELLRRAGIGPGHHVLDIGCGAGDVSMLAAELVGPTGFVLGIDRAPEALTTTRQRAADAGLTWVEVADHDLANFDDGRTFDAVIGRLRPGGTIAFLEMDVSAADARPASPLWTLCRGWVGGAMRAGGFEPDMGSRLYEIYRAADLIPKLAAFGLAGGGQDRELADYLADTIRSLLPAIVACGLATEAEVDVDTLAERLVRESGGERRTVYAPRLTAAWATIPTP